MGESDRLPTTADNAALVSIGLLGLTGALAIGSLIFPWWVGTTTLSKLVSDTAVSAEITLWSVTAQVGVQTADGAGGTTLAMETRDMTWGQMCDTLESTADGGAPTSCSRVPMVIAMMILSSIFAFVGVIALQIARVLSPLLLLLGGFMSLLSGACSLGGVGLGSMISMSGFQGLGAIFAAVSLITAAVALSAASYSAGIAMPVDPPKIKNRMTRQQRVQEQRDKDLEVARQLQENAASRADFGYGIPENEKKPPVVLQKILFWSEEHGGDADAEGIPTEWLEAAFQEIDEDGSGAIDVTELVDCLNICGLQATVQATENIMKEIDKNMSGDIDIHEFVEFFRALEELDRFQAKTTQRAQFAQLLCNFCFIAHIIIVSALLMNFINMKEADDPDNYLIVQYMLRAFSVVLCFLLFFVICLPAARLTLGANIAAWERQYHLELKKRLDRKPSNDAAEEGFAGPNLRLAANTGNQTVDGLTDLTVNSAVFGASYRVSKQTFFQQSALPGILGETGGGRRASRQSRTGRLSVTSQATANTESVFKTKDGGFERYKPDAYAEAARRAAETRMPTSFSPMQVRDMDMPRPETQLPGTLALQDEQPTVPGALTGTGFYKRAL